MFQELYRDNFRKVDSNENLPVLPIVSAAQDINNDAAIKGDRRALGRRARVNFYCTRLGIAVSPNYSGESVAV